MSRLWHRWAHRDPFKHFRCWRCSDKRWAWAAHNYATRDR